MLGFCSSPRFVDHVTTSAHPERPDRIRAIYAALTQGGWIDSPSPFPDFDLDFGPLARPSRKLLELPVAPVQEKWLETVHTPQHVQHVRHVSSVGGGVLDSGDTPVSANSYQIALLAAGALLTCCDAVMAGKVQRAFAAVRPPGHHAEPQRPMGFCLFSNIAIAARYLQRQHGLKRIAIVDFDVHHGNGTQACFEEDPSVLFISLHQDPRTCYPGTGHAWETGFGAGEGYTLNIPFEPGSGNTEYQAAFDQLLLPKLRQFAPEFLLISAGFDAHADDPLAHIQLTDDSYTWMTRRLVETADQTCHGRVVSVLEGGYNLRALGRSVLRHLAAME